MSETEQQKQQEEREQPYVLPLWAFLEERASEWVLSLYRLYRLMQVEQQALLLDLGYSGQERMKLAGMLSDHLEAIGIALYSDAGVESLSLSGDEVGKLLPAGLVQTLFYELLCRAPFGSVQGNLTERLAGFLPFARYYRKDYEARYGRLSDDAFRDTRKRPATPAEKHAPAGMPSLPSADGPIGSRVAIGRTRRTTGRVGERYVRAVSET